MEQRIVVRGGEGESTETASVSGALSTLREAKLGLLTGKKVVQALVRIEKDDMAWQGRFWDGHTISASTCSLWLASDIF